MTKPNMEAMAEMTPRERKLYLAQFDPDKKMTVERLNDMADASEQLIDIKDEMRRLATEALGIVAEVYGGDSVVVDRSERGWFAYMLGCLEDQESNVGPSYPLQEVIDTLDNGKEDAEREL